MNNKNKVGKEGRLWRLVFILQPLQQTCTYISYSPFSLIFFHSINILLTYYLYHKYVWNLIHTHVSLLYIKSEILNYLLWGKMWAPLCFKASKLIITSSQHSTDSTQLNQNEIFGALLPCSVNIKVFSWLLTFLSPVMSQLVHFPAHLPLVEPRYTYSQWLPFCLSFGKFN